ncbi:ATP-binding protein [Pseudanabaena sp. ABRG5-3]|uniref:ATP-binding protein n=1 Tax=Pseudanabaena sp. ABRG5-3 TaxID=685565 RepID=UPI000DC6E622|nr:ATP-binding protein [Pseudanabaena sp. ABRG5-3]BBC25617.1 trypsin-like protein serine protease [Pseudanabaena sp. ABRG5-3]
MANWRLNGDGQKFFEERLKEKGWFSLNDTQLSDQLRVDRSIVAKLRNGKQEGHKSKLEDVMIALGEDSEKVKSEAFARKYFQEIKNSPKSQLEQEIISAAKETLVIQDNLGEFDNPFQPTNCRIENPEQFFNREKEVRTIFEYLNSGSGVELLGDRQIGKSSVLLQVERLAETMLRVKREPIYFNLQEVHTEDEFYEAFCEKLGIETCKGYGFFRAMRDKRLLLLLDEAEKMSWDGFTRQIREQLRSLAEGGNAPLRLVVAARTPLDDLFPDSHESGMTSPFQGICVRVDLKAWEQPTVQRFITSKLENTGVCFSNTEMEKLWFESQGHPQKLMKACFDLYRQYC